MGVDASKQHVITVKCLLSGKNIGCCTVHSNARVQSKKKNSQAASLSSKDQRLTFRLLTNNIIPSETTVSKGSSKHHKEFIPPECLMTPRNL